MYKAGAPYSDTPTAVASLYSLLLPSPCHDSNSAQCFNSSTLSLDASTFPSCNKFMDNHTDTLIQAASTSSPEDSVHDNFIQFLPSVLQQMLQTPIRLLCSRRLWPAFLSSILYILHRTAIPKTAFITLLFIAFISPLLASFSATFCALFDFSDNLLARLDRLMLLVSSSSCFRK